MAKWSVTGEVRGGKYLGEIEAETLEEAEELAWQRLDCGVHLCHQCVGECEDGEIHELNLSKVD